MIVMLKMNIKPLGGVVEWFKALVLKTSVSARAPWVRIPPPPLLLKIRRSQLVLLENHKHFFIGNIGFLKLDLFLPDSDCSIKNKNVFGLLVFLLDIRVKKIEMLG